jgi:CHRD domain
MKRLSLLAIALSILAAACGSSTLPSSPTKPTFTADLRPANEVPPITGAEAGGSGSATITFDTAASSVTFVVNMTGFPAGTPINVAHIHTGASGVAGGVLISTALAAGEVTLANGSGSFTKTVSNLDNAVMQNIINNPAGFYFNIHSSANPGGVARGQLVKVG